MRRWSTGSRAGAAHRGARQLRLAGEEGGHALARFLARARLGGRGVDGDAEIDAALAGMPRFTPSMTISRELALEISELGGAQAHEDGQAHAPGGGEGLVAGRGHADGRMRLLHRLRHHHRALHAVELALVAEGLAPPGEADDVQRLAEARLALHVGDAVEIVGAHHTAAPDAELEAPPADVIDGGHFLGDAERVIERQHLHRGAHAESLGARGDRARHLERGRDHRAGGREVNLPQPHAWHAPGLAAVGQLEDVAEGLGLARALA